MKRSSMSVRSAARAAVVVVLCAAGVASAGDVRVLLGVDPADSTGDVLLSASLAPAQSLTRVTGQRTTIAQTSTMSDVMRASRTVENEIIIAPAHVTASAILHVAAEVELGRLAGDDLACARRLSGRLGHQVTLARRPKRSSRYAPLASTSCSCAAASHASTKRV